MRNLIAAGCLCAATALALPVTAQDTDYSADTVLATVNGTEITLGHVIALRSKLPQDYQSIPDEILFPGILDQLVDQTLLSQKIEEERGGVPTGVRLSTENERRGLMAALALRELEPPAPSDAELQEAYETYILSEEPTPEFNASHILVESEDEAAAIVAELEGGADFAELAMEKSTGPSGPNGGELGWFGPGMMVPPFEEAVMALEAGGISAPVQTQFGWHVIKLNDQRMTEPPSLEDARPELENLLRQEGVEAALDEIREAAEITRDLEAVPADAFRNTDLIID
ncbi:peptidylprolyl isomerase [Oceanomicrobium pacificus]|uniref:Parvulin-like PPIase n=1 Tax=Oceanomicrobium pacificus TaxID=2692916 RepID=A0A6B0TJZ2_9RHOB|nr:peptidylprolyl isomerase [Oceanomicrobium pacificus]MXU64767.1 peptidylprolyl isomerase [Oceanomicrobium pacificus]